METMNRRSVLGQFVRFGVVGLAVGVMGTTAMLAYASGGGATPASTSAASNPVATTEPAPCPHVFATTPTPSDAPSSTSDVVYVIHGQDRLPSDCTRLYSVIDHTQPFGFA